MVYGVTELVVNAVPVVGNMTTAEPGWRTMYSGGGKASSGVEVTETTALGYAPFWRAVSLIASDVAGMPCDLFRRQKDGGKKYDRKHPATRLIRDNASSWCRADVWRRTLTYHANVHGNGFAPIVRSMSGAPMALGIVDPCGMMMRIDDDGQLWYVWYESGKAVRVKSQDMVHIRGMSRDGLIGMSQLNMFRDALGVGMAAAKFGGKFFANGSNMSGLLMIPGHFSEEKVRNTMSAWKDMNTGLNKSSGVALLQDGVKFQPLTIEPNKAQFIETREFEVRQTVSNITGVPPHMLGDSTRTSHNSLESESQSYLHRCLNPWLKEWEQELRAKLLTDKQRDDESHLIEFNREAEVQMSFADKINGIYRQIESGLLNANEGRRLLNMPSIGEDGDVYYHPANWTVVGEEPEVQTPTPATPESGDTDPDDSPSGETENVLRSMITSTITKDLKIERDRVVQRAGMRAAKFEEAIEEFYATWTNETASGLTSSDARICIIAHAEESKRLLASAHAVSTTASLKNNVEDVVATWETRGVILIDALMKAVKQ